MYYHSNCDICDLLFSRPCTVARIVSYGVAWCREFWSFFTVIFLVLIVLDLLNVLSLSSHPCSHCRSPAAKIPAWLDGATRSCSLENGPLTGKV